MAAMLGSVYQGNNYIWEKTNQKSHHLTTRLKRVKKSFLGSLGKCVAQFKARQIRGACLTWTVLYGKRQYSKNIAYPSKDRKVETSHRTYDI